MTKQLLKINDICELYDVEFDFIDKIIENELIPTVENDSELFIEENELPVLEKIINLHYDLGVNIEGIEVILNLLEKIDELNEEITRLNRIVKYFDQEL
jgi:hypothetical protein